MSQEEEREETLLNEDAQRELQMIDDEYLIQINILKSLAKKSKQPEEELNEKIDSIKKEHDKKFYQKYQSVMIERVNKKFPVTCTFPKEVIEEIVFKIAENNGKPLQDRLWALHLLL